MKRNIDTALFKEIVSNYGNPLENYAVYKGVREYFRFSRIYNENRANNRRSIVWTGFVFIEDFPDNQIIADLRSNFGDERLENVVIQRERRNIRIILKA